ncbi:MAG TPA: hypothetical protein VD865_08760, partial [Stenotrophomonas sp.]|nr:hypothetical protein [Stenotrophomonas sp.]
MAESANAVILIPNISCTSGSGPSTPGRTVKTGTTAATDGSGTFSLVAGCSANGGGQLGVTVYGSYASVTGSGGTAVGFNAGSGKWASSFGVDTSAAGVGSSALGFGSQATGLGAVSIGSAAGNGTSPLSVADSTTASGAGSIAIGANAQRGAKALNANSIALGGQATSQANDAIAIGTGSSANQAGSVALGSGSVANRGNAISVGSTSLQRQVVNLARGTADTDAVNVSQLKAVVNSLGGGAAVNADGTLTAPTYNVGGTTTNNVGDALTAVDGRVTNLGDQLNNGTIGLVQQDATSRNITVAKDTDGTQVSFAGTAGDRVLTSVAKGAVNETSTEAVNGSQLYGTNKSVADSLGGGSQVNPDGTITGPTYTVGGTTVNNVGDAISNVDGRVTNNATAITNLGDQLNNGTI